MSILCPVLVYRAHVFTIFTRVVYSNKSVNEKKFVYVVTQVTGMLAACLA